MKGKEKTFSTATNSEIWGDFVDAELKAELAKASPLYQALRKPAPAEPWCCERTRRTTRQIVFQDGTSMRVHFCPRCGREL